MPRTLRETFANVLRTRRSLRSQDDIGYLLRVLRNTFFSQRRAAARHPQTMPVPDELDLFALISSLPMDFRDALIAVDLVGLSYREPDKTTRSSRRPRR